MNVLQQKSDDEDVLNGDEITNNSDLNDNITNNDSKIKAILNNIIIQENDLNGKIIMIKEWLSLHETAYNQVILTKKFIIKL
mmetsp:Transcript_29772/g.36480  ORF Transcript_29772/g.36480 Transcript_29772/m.36480 type:complete len:82 (-) Transcript_29772:11-256(-)